MTICMYVQLNYCLMSQLTLLQAPSVLESEGNWLVPEQPAPECESVPGCDTTRLVVGCEDN